MKTAFLALILLSACTAGGVATQGQGLLIPAVNYSVDYFPLSGCTDYIATTNSSGTFMLNGMNADGTTNDKFVPNDDVIVTVRPNVPHSQPIYYRFHHAFDLQCANPGGGNPIPCTKDLFMITGLYDELSGNAPGPDVHVRLYDQSIQASSASALSTKHGICNIK
jgi:hypothetical protein